MNIQSYKVVELLNSLDKEALKKMKSALLSPGTNLKPQQQAVLKILFLYSKREDRLQTTIVNELGLHQNRIDDLMNKILMHVEEYLINITIKPSSEIEKLYDLLGLYSKLHLKRHYNAILTKIKRVTQNKHQVISSDENRYYYLLLKSTEVHEKIKAGRGIKKKEIEYIIYLDIAYYIEKLKVCCELINRSKILAGTINQEYIETQIANAEKYKRINLLIRLYGDFIRIFLYKPKITPKVFLQLFKVYKTLPVNDELRGDNITIATYLINICLNEQKKDNLSVAVILVRVVDFMKEKNLILEQGVISFSLMKSIVSASIKLGQLEWSESFYSAYKKFIDADIKDVGTAYIEALFHFNKGNFQLAWSKTSNVSLKAMDVLLKINFMQQQIQIAIELKIGAPSKDKEYLNGIFNKLLYLLRSSKIGKTNQEKTYNFIKYAKVLTKRKSPEQYLKFLKALQLENPVSEKPWLVRKMKEKAGK